MSWTSEFPRAPYPLRPAARPGTGDIKYPDARFTNPGKDGLKRVHEQPK